MIAPTTRSPISRLLSLVLVAGLALPLAGCGKRTKKRKEEAPPPDRTLVEQPRPGDQGAHMLPGTSPNPTPAPLSVPVNPIDPETVVVRVNGKAITQAELDDTMFKMLRIGRNPRMDVSQLRQRFGAQAEKQAVDLVLLEQAVAKADVKLAPDAVDAKIQEIASQFPSRAEFLTRLSQGGLTEADLEDEVARSLKLEQWLDAQAKTPAPDDAAVQAYYEKHKAAMSRPEQVRARHVLLKVEPGASEAAQAKVKAELEALREKIVAGDEGEFAKVAHEHSACPTGKQAGGDLGLFPRGKMVPEFDAVAFKLAPGTVSEVFKTSFGYHIMRVEEKQAAGVPPLEKVQERIKQRLTQERLNTAHKDALEALRSSAKIERPGADAGGSAGPKPDAG